MPALLMTILRVGATWLGRIGLAAFATNEIIKLTQTQKDTIINSSEKAEAEGFSEDNQKQLIAATTYEQVEKAGKDPDDFWQGLSEKEQEALKFSPKSLKASMDRTSFLGISQTILWVAAGVAAGVAGFRGIPILISTLSKLRTARGAGASALSLLTIIEEGKIAGIAKVWVPGLVAGIAAAGGWLTSGLTNNMNDALLWGRVFLDQAHSDIEKASKNKTTSYSSGGSGLTTSQGPRTIIRMVEEKKPMQFLGTLFSAKLGKLEHFDRQLDDEITDMQDLEADVVLNLNKWLKTLPGRMGYSIVIRKDPVDETGVQQSGIWATATLHVLQLSGKIMPIDTILLGPVSPQVRLELSKSTKTIETQIDGIISAQEIREIDIPNGVVDIFSADGSRATLNKESNTTQTTTTPSQASKTGFPYLTDYNEVIQAGGSIVGKNPNGKWEYRNPDGSHNIVSDKDYAFLSAKVSTPTTPTPTPTPTPVQTNTNSTVSALASAGTLRFGASGEAVKEIQVLLNNWGENLLTDGVWGSKTDTAVRKFQAQNNLAVDGIVGPMTKAALFEKGR